MNLFQLAPLTTPNDSAYNTGRFGATKESHQVLSGHHSLTDGTTSNFQMDGEDSAHVAQRANFFGGEDSRKYTLSSGVDLQVTNHGVSSDGP